MKFSEAGRIRQNRSETFVACDHMTAIEIRPYHRRPKVLEAAQRRACVFGETSGNQLRAQPRERWRREAPSRKASAYVRLQPLTRRPGEQSPYLGDGAAVAAAAGAFCVVEVLLPIFFGRLRTLVPFLRWMFGITIILSVMVCSYGVETLRGSGPVPVMTHALPFPKPLPAVTPVVPVPVICPFASPQMKDPAQTPTKMICESLDNFIVVSV